MNFGFFPRTLEEYLAVANASELRENAYLRQVLSYWEMAASFVVRGVFHPDAFLDSCSEGMLVYAKLKPLVAQVRDQRDPDFLQMLERAVEGHPQLARFAASLDGWITRQLAKRGG